VATDVTQLEEVGALIKRLNVSLAPSALQQRCGV
jgi:hypothetical protein